MFHFTIMSLANNRISSTEGVEYPLLRKLNLNYDRKAQISQLQHPCTRNRAPPLDYFRRSKTGRMPSAPSVHNSDLPLIRPSYYFVGSTHILMKIIRCNTSITNTKCHKSRYTGRLKHIRIS
ncbi:uncharacterized protein LOC143230570 isoform X2 [Tachypleus tridentatus]|uniref:uncharacterized protein LOC143230570 isoform X2 n=1 Tax=Tachypleus tridentatus TaxID=6853 RepID=UPI003FD673A9